MTIIDRLEALLGTPVRGTTDLGSSHAWSMYRAVLGDGRAVFAKVAVRPSEALVAERRGLMWLRGGSGYRVESGVEGNGRDGGSKLLPGVIAADDSMLVLPWLSETGPSVASADRFGADLAALHQHSPGFFGAPWPGRIADLPLDNTRVDGSWGSWYAERRLSPYLRVAADSLGVNGVRLVRAVIDRIETLAGPPEPPARLHGDLWSGNVMWAEGGVVLIDPAAHGGHRETDLAMLALFGAPHLDRIIASYNRVHPLAAGWRARVALHQLHPLLVHTVLFGAAYGPRTIAAARTALGH